MTLLEAIGSGLPLIGFDVRYGNQTFIRDGENGYLIPRSETDDESWIVSEFVDRIVNLFKSDMLKTAHEVSYDLAKDYLTTEVEEKWRVLIEEATR